MGPGTQVTQGALEGECRGRDRAAWHVPSACIVSSVLLETDVFEREALKFEALVNGRRSCDSLKSYLSDPDAMLSFKV